ncbi:MAG TPA: bifunctional (p)ppGpp synthetase/guanosine-3',5'-bis(diphosphate) 3'-pyrophosphohydrolase [Casimicrobium huifangae]|nr:bifunctional (p)ppGpp synthetase/guanosine-3',5'-bis(diphosphate) 3'-pyrophosphohydrolase [Casimicrobium huifangae]HQD63639.1 bifunctional (p)ppGpp synthetase/guanosine-3',5'-bis(diphosphate) 3'-pyrophosphohydrolase [Casimicrobium huifangae]
MSDLPVSEPVVVPSSAEGNGVRNDVSVWVAARAGDAVAARGEAAAVLMERLRMGDDCVAAARLIGLPADADTEQAVQQQFGAEIGQLFVGVHRMATMQGLQRGAGTAASMVPPTAAQQAQQTEALRKMLLAMVDDVRVVLLKLAERLVSLRSAALSTEARRNESAQAEAREVMEVFAPLANRLGVWQLKWELEDLSLRLLEPHQYHSIARYLDETRIEREAYIDTTKALLRDALAAAGIDCEISGRSKHIYSIYEKLKRKHCSIEELYDIRAVRVMVDEVKDCYAALGIVHSMFQPVPGEFDDYIAKPKANNYRSLHTSVIGPQQRALEVQIRTREMHQASEYGVAAHWNYKEGGNAARDTGFASKLASLRQVLSWGKDVSSPGEFLAGFKSSLFEETIFVLTPQGKIIDLPKDATPIDFAYAVHSGLGHRCRGAKVDGVMVPLNTPLKNGQRIEITTVKEGGPSRDWLNPDNGYIRSNRARGKVRQWFNTLELQETLAHGRAVVEKDLQRHGQTALNLDKLTHEAGFKSQDDFFAAVGRAEVNSRDLDIAIRKAAGLLDEAAETASRGEVHTSRSRAKAESGGILVVGVDKLMTGLAKCCKPVPPDPIVGFVTRLKGITIHRADCSNVQRMMASEPNRIIDADWGDAAQNDLFSVQIDVIASDRQGLLRDISDVLAREKINVTAVNTLTRDFVAKMKFTAEVRSMDQLRAALVQVAQVKGVQSARRV